MSISKNKKIVLRAIAVLSVVGLIWFALAHLPHTGNVDAKWPTRSNNHTLLLRPATSNESLRLVDYAPDHQTITGMRIEFRDGKTALVSYQNGLPTMIKQYAPEPTPADPADTAKKLVVLKKLGDDLASRHLQSVIEIKADGKTVKSLTTYNADGGLAAIGVRDSSDDFAVTMYGAGANGISGIAVFSGTDGSLKSEQDFREDGTVASSFTTSSDYGSNAKQTFFDSDGHKTKEILYNGENDVTINEFGPDGKTVIAKTSFGYSGVTVTTYDATGTKPVLERNYADDTHINVRYFDDKGNATMKQLWVKLDTTAVPADRVGVVNDGFYLDEVYEYHDDGSSTRLDVNFYPGGKIVKEYLSRPTTNYRPSVDQHFRDDGSLDYTSTCGAETSYWSDCTTTKAPDGPNKIRAKIPASFSKTTPLLPAPTAQKPTVPAFPLTVDLR